MKKYYYLLASIAIIGFCTNSAMADVDVVQSEAGGQVTIAPGVTGAPTMKFNPSTNVFIHGTSVDTAFQISGYHTAGDLKANGQAYGMASDVNKLYWLDISGTAYAEPSGTNSAAFGSWNLM